MQSSNEFTQSLISTKDSIPSSENERIWFTPIQPLPVFAGYEHIDNRRERKKCSDEKIISFIAKHLKYPKEAKKDSIGGTVVLLFTIEANSSITFNKDLSKAIPRGIKKHLGLSS